MRRREGDLVPPRAESLVLRIVLAAEGAVVQVTRVAGAKDTGRFLVDEDQLIDYVRHWWREQAQAEALDGRAGAGHSGGDDAVTQG